MTVATTGGDSANPWGDFSSVGLEDVSSADVSMPRLVIDHDTAQFKDSSTGQMFSSLTAVVLGLVKQRIMWDTQIDDNDRPQCKSPDFKIGYPQMRTDIPARKQFPWDKSNFNKADHPEDENGQIKLPCDSCIFTSWGKDKEKPPCSEQWTYVLYYQDDEGAMRPGLCSFQRSGAKAAKSYAGMFQASRQPMFTVWTNILLTPESRGKTKYATPKFTKGEPTESSMWREYADGYYSARDFLHEPPRAATKEEDDKAAAKRAAATPASATSATKLADDDPWATSSPAAASAAPPVDNDDDLPF